jgi:hypothetical protein
MYTTKRTNKNLVDGNAYNAIGDPYKTQLENPFRQGVKGEVRLSPSFLVLSRPLLGSSHLFLSRLFYPLSSSLVLSRPLSALRAEPHSGVVELVLLPSALLALFSCFCLQFLLSPRLSSSSIGSESLAAWWRFCFPLALVVLFSCFCLQFLVSSRLSSSLIAEVIRLLQRQT